ncbi:amino acid/amide ABC transporter membrane protein 1, HAAT family (TC 3.A.1.4.-) [Modicisalibacter muralis]|uniref:Amino acid/amide ABC transporter membrane protein 1, HAAT family (TC 3.A.1.4.-) n=2 Tax=Modicisalibacter muralis TaxID=119000 RepID=A0A1G9ESZ9_9GAMM|nr:amino acid/amide ABC transporter membrane protein 1, HAAT family (TC 3.A.1.4.-) [Halomonas muralis]
MNVSLDLILAQMMLGLSAGVFYAMLSLGLAIIFGLLNVINFAHGALYMLGAFVALIGHSYIGPWLGYEDFQLGFWPALIVAPLLVGCFGMLLERTMLRRLYQFDHIYGLLLTFGIALMLQGFFTNYFNVSGTPYGGQPESLNGIVNLGFMYFPKFRLFAIVMSIVVCFLTWFVIERTRLGAVLRAGVENPKLVQAFGINVPLMVTLTFGFGVALAALAGVLAAPIYSVSPLMGANLIIVVFAVVVIGGMGSIMGAIVTGLTLGLIQGLTKAIYPPAANTVIFFIMVIVLLVRPAGLFGKE